MKKTQKRRLDIGSESKAVIEHAFALARDLGIRKLLIQAGEIADQRWVRRHQQEETLIWLAHGEANPSRRDEKNNYTIRLPGHELSRMDQIQIGLMMAVSENVVEIDETILTLTGLAGSNRLDNLLITNPRRDHQWLQDYIVDAAQGKMLRSHEFFILLEIALRFAQEGREGKSIGTTFVLGDPRRLKPHLKQMILNPCQGHPQKARNIHQPDFIETLREYAALDGAFIISQRGVVERAGTYLAPPSSRKRIKVRPGQGARHTSASALTATCDTVAIVLSESSASVTVYYRGATILELNQQR